MGNPSCPSPSLKRATILCLGAGLVALSACSGSDTPGTNAAGASGSAGLSASAGVSAGGATAGGGGSAGGGAGTAGSATAGAGGSVAGAAGSANAGGGAGTGGSAGSGGSVGLTGKQDIMVLGSSNELITCWRAFLWQKLQAAEIKNFDFVGGVTQGDDCGVAGYDKDLQAQSGIIVSNLTAAQFQGWFSAHPPDMILMHFGGADLLNNMPVSGVIKGYTLMLTEARKIEPKVRLFAAQHTPQDSASCNDCENTTLQLNADMVTWAAANTTADSPITIIDLYTGFVPATDLSDGVHLNVSGSTKVADRFFAALQPLFKP